jgi:hemerythrin
MDFITWSERLETGIQNIDKQHRRWVNLINDLHRAVAEGREQEGLREALDALVDYTQYHFRTEEALMKQAKYDEEEFELHCREHRVFTDQIVIFRDRLDVGFTKMSPEVTQYLRGWLVNHVTASDRGYIRPIKDAGLD